MIKIGEYIVTDWESSSADVDGSYRCYRTIETKNTYPI